MSNSPIKLDYVEFPAQDLAATEAFFRTVFGWQFTHFGADYIGFEGGGLDGGFFRSSQASQASQGGALLIFQSDDLPALQARIEAAGGQICQPIFEFPGGRRFHFTEPSGNELAVWQAVESP